MTQIEEKVDLPGLDDFTESSLLDQIKNKDEETEEEIAAREEEDDAAAKLKEEDEAARLEDEDAEKARLAKEQEDEELTEEEKAELAKKEAEEGNFWDDVDKITGNSYEIDYGDTEPDSPEGAALREETVAKKAIEDNLAYLEDKFPEGFKALMHISNGGQLKDLFSPDTVDYKSLVIEDTNVDAQKAFMKDYYIEKGFSEAKAVRNVEDDEDSEEGLLDNFKAALKEKQDGQESASKATFEKQEKAKVEQDAQDKKFGESLSSIINAGKVGNFQIAKKDAEGFYNHVLQHIERKGNGYALNVPLTNDNFQEQLQQLFFGFKKGDLSKFVETSAKTQNAKRLKRSMQKDKGLEESSSEAEKRKYGKKLPTMGDFGEN